MVLVRKLSLIPGVNFPYNGSTCYNIDVVIFHSKLQINKTNANIEIRPNANTEIRPNANP